MIQRVQSIFLALAAIAMIVMIFQPIWGKDNQDKTQQLRFDASTLVYKNDGKEVNNSNTIYLTVLAFVSASLAAGSLFSYKNRMTQIKLNLFNALILLVVVILIAYNMYTSQKLFDPTNPGSLKIGFFMPIAALFFNSLANRFIKRDEKLVRSVDRLR